MSHLWHAVRNKIRLPHDVMRASHDITRILTTSRVVLYKDAVTLTSLPMSLDIATFSRGHHFSPDVATFLEINLVIATVAIV